ncbi:MAG: hypothetical protein HC926_05420 [Synechococcaceae cyanobacterium SM2_3_60]|nr:hypothetical protein [Synechococcaceae cyanobacterium SM2_3_60]
MFTFQANTKSNQLSYEGEAGIKIRESAEELNVLMDSQSKAIQRSKVQMLWWLKSSQALQMNRLAELSAVTAPFWLSQYCEGGLSQLLSEGLSHGLFKRA